MPESIEKKTANDVNGLTKQLNCDMCTVGHKGCEGACESYLWDPEEVVQLLEKVRLKDCYHQANPCTKEQYGDKPPYNRPCTSCHTIFSILGGN